MASLKFLLFVVFIIAFFSSVTAIEMQNTEEIFNNAQEPSVVDGKQGVVKSEDSTPPEIALEGEALLKECANKFIKSCEELTHCRQVVCPSDTLQEYACLPRGHQYLPLKTSVCNGEFTITPESPKIIDETIKENPRSGFGLLLIFPILIAMLFYIFDKVTSESGQTFVYEDLEYNPMTYLKKPECDDYYALDETVDSLNSRLIY
ncbi:unnamed protein product [Moneuplotes crassus]|uniref:Uncharacterized protein n=1 Tax=Euplotes crassus TaxID=5936 RepID=A0AAD2D237_EUPCR|nr:unnamed protein product [Moneuplotes crassus]